MISLSVHGNIYLKDAYRMQITRRKPLGGACEIVPAPFAVFLSKDGQNYMEPDLSVICSLDKPDEKGCHGAPDWIIEIVSPSTERMDYGIKLFKYRSAGVREYRIVNPLNHH